MYFYENHYLPNINDHIYCPILPNIYPMIPNVFPNIYPIYGQYLPNIWPIFPIITQYFPIFTQYLPNLMTHRCISMKIIHHSIHRQEQLQVLRIMGSAGAALEDICGRLAALAQGAKADRAGEGGMDGKLRKTRGNL